MAPRQPCWLIITGDTLRHRATPGMRLAVVLSAASLAAASDFVALVEWARSKCGATIPSDLQQRTDGARDIMTKAPLKASDVVFTIPDECLLTTAKAIGHPSTFGLFDPQTAQSTEARRTFYEKRDNSVLLPLYLLHLMDEGDEGFYAPYVRSLPESVDNFPCLWDEDTVSLLPFNTIVDVFTVCNRIRAFYDDICAVVPAFGEQHGYADFQRAWLLVNSRDFQLTINGETHTALGPIHDLFNHDAQANVRWNHYQHRGRLAGEVGHMNVSDGKFIEDADFVVPAGTQLRISYSQHSQSELLLYYGFTLPCGWETRWRALLPNHTSSSNSNHDSAAIPMCIDKLKLRTESAAYELTATRDSPGDAAFLESVSADQPASRWRAVRELVKSAEFPIDVSEAGGLLEAATPGSHEYDALNVLLGQWSVAQAWISHATEMVAREESLPHSEGASSKSEL